MIFRFAKQQHKKKQLNFWRIPNHTIQPDANYKENKKTTFKLIEIRSSIYLISWSVYWKINHLQHTHFQRVILSCELCLCKNNKVLLCRNNTTTTTTKTKTNIYWTFPFIRLPNLKQLDLLRMFNIISIKIIDRHTKYKNYTNKKHWSNF